MRRRPWSRSVRAVALALALLVSAVGCAAQQAPPTPPQPLRILLVNDDGWNAPGIVLLRDALRRAGHQVVEVAPHRNAGFAGTGTTLLGRLVLDRPTRDPDVWRVIGMPADAAMIGLRHIMGTAPPDLVLSGVDPSPNLGTTALRSGTVGAAAATALFNVPSVAVSTQAANPFRPRPEELAPAVDFTVRLVAEIARTPAGIPRLPERTVLNVNYPGGTAKARAVVAAPTANRPAVTTVYRPNPNGTLQVVSRPTAADEDGDTDVAAVARGSVTLTDLSADPDRSNPPVRAAARLAPLLTP